MGFLASTLLFLAQAHEPVHAFVELEARPASVFVQQPVRVTIRVGVEREYLRHNLLQLFTRALDVPVQLELAWDAALANTIALDPGAPDSLAPHPSFALGEEIVRAARSREETRDGATWMVLELERALLPLAPGTIELPAPALHYACATRFEQDLVAGAVPLDRSSAVVRGRSLALAVAPLPQQGRPAGFVDAVGRFTIAAEAEPRELDVGDTLKLRLTVEGQGNLEQLALPRLDGLPGLHLLASRAESTPGKRTLACELVVESTRAREIPAIALDSFDPDARAYRSASTQPIALSIRAPAPAPGGSLRAFPGSLVLAGIVVLALAALGWLLVRRRSA